MFIFIILFNYLIFRSIPNSFAEMQGTATPVFLKYGYSAILEFEEEPIKAVLGNQNSYYIEKLNHSIVIKPLESEASTNLFIYFKKLQPKLFILTTHDDVKPTFYKKIESIQIPYINKKVDLNKNKHSLHSIKSKILTRFFDEKKDYFIIEGQIHAPSDRLISPHWTKVTLKQNKTEIKPNKVWAERKEIQKDSTVKFKFIFIKPNISKYLSQTILEIPTTDSSLTFSLRKSK